MDNFGINRVPADTMRAGAALSDEAQLAVEIIWIHVVVQESQMTTHRRVDLPRRGAIRRNRTGEKIIVK